ncbi:MAG: ribosome silencing factor [candidate division WOR-3 bacterium]
MDVLKGIIKILEENAAEDIVVLDIREVNPVLCDYMIVATGYTSDHLISLGEKLIESFGGRVEGNEESVWVLVDLGDIIIHLFTPQAREFYALEDLYEDANRIEIYAEDN